MSLSDDLLSGAREIAGFTGLTEKQVYNYAEAGQIPVFRIGRRIYSRKSQLEQAFAAPAVAA